MPDEPPCKYLRGDLELVRTVAQNRRGAFNRGAGLLVSVDLFLFDVLLYQVRLLDG